MFLVFQENSSRPILPSLSSERKFFWEKLKKAEEEARLFAINKPEVIKVVREEAKKLGIHPKAAITTKASEKFKKTQDAEHDALKRKHAEKKPRITRLTAAISSHRVHVALSHWSADLLPLQPHRNHWPPPLQPRTTCINDMSEPPPRGKLSLDSRRHVSASETHMTLHW
ncbi:hypothetical protein Tco_1509628 [Tanacetum coccineum]